MLRETGALNLVGVLPTHLLDTGVLMFMASSTWSGERLKPEKMDPELEQRLADQLRMIEMGETLEDLDDPEDYEDEGGIRSLNRAPSIKMASETGPEEFELELGIVVKEYLDKNQRVEK